MFKIQERGLVRIDHYKGVTIAQPGKWRDSPHITNRFPTKEEAVAYVEEQDVDGVFNDEFYRVVPA